MTKGGKAKWGRLALISGAVAAWQVYDMATATEYPSAALSVLQYVLLGCAIVGLVGSAWKYFTVE